MIFISISFPSAIIEKMEWGPRAIVQKGNKNSRKLNLVREIKLRHKTSYMFRNS